MKTCGLVVEYNPFHNGHVHHINQSRQTSEADCIIAVMSGSFLQRGEPAIIDKFHRAKAALLSGADIILELPYVYAVQGSNFFADGAVRVLNEIGVDSICFGSESGDISRFLYAYHQLEAHQNVFSKTLTAGLDEGLSYPSASKYAYLAAGIDPSKLDLSKPNNILGFSYVKSIMALNNGIRPLTIKRIKNDYHDADIRHAIASATSIRQELLKHEHISDAVQHALPDAMYEMLLDYQMKTNIWHTWEHYFPYLKYKVITMSPMELAEIQGVDEGLEHRIKKTAKTAVSFNDWVARIKTKRYTWTRLQRMFVHILTGTKKKTAARFLQDTQAPYVRLLGMTPTGRTYLSKQKKKMSIPLISRMPDLNHEMLDIEERAQDVYYSILEPNVHTALFQQELKGPIMVDP
ncbi:UPF0348 protein [Lentibacillus sp. JNUCC-1]|uniref:nucleotidyltransferase n=1 Tax=Lentibacillus sp. JNUCC-1 TaxID=2654513 RepID=UPI0012E929A7|nr:nucleotidyltransferase [Lentibacillus sp. JNUCC-1]MUV36237.1 UPF0348 protein [Lentibacillus sp. JNUCC-1]